MHLHVRSLDYLWMHNYFSTLCMHGAVRWNVAVMWILQFKIKQGASEQNNKIQHSG